MPSYLSLNLLSWIYSPKTTIDGMLKFKLSIIESQKENFMREKLATLPLAELRKIAKEKGIKSVTTIRKSDLIEQIAILILLKAELQVFHA